MCCFNLISDKEAPKQAANGVPKSRGKKANSTKTDGPLKEAKESVKSVVFKGKSPVDGVCPIKDKVCVAPTVELACVQ